MTLIVNIDNFFRVPHTCEPIPNISKGLLKLWSCLSSLYGMPLQVNNGVDAQGVPYNCEHLLELFLDVNMLMVIKI